MAAENYTLGRGELHFSLFKTGTNTPAGFRYLGITPEFGLTINTEYLDLFNSDHGIREKVQSVPVETTRQGNFSCVDIEMDNLANFFFGSKSTIAQTATTGDTETFTDVIQGMSYQIGLTDATPTGVHSVSNVAITGSVLGTDYLVDATLGIVTIVAGGNIASGDDVTITYDRAAGSIDQVISGTEPVEGTLRFIADNPQGANLDYFMPRVKLSPNGDFSLKTEEWQTIPFNLEILKLTGKEAIYINGRPYTGS